MNILPLITWLYQLLASLGGLKLTHYPQLFLVRAHDKQDCPVTMVINPDGVAAVTQMGVQDGSGGNQSNSKSTDTKKQ